MLLKTLIFLIVNLGELECLALECLAEFRFCNNDLHVFVDVFQIPQHVIGYNGSKIPKIEVLYISQKRFSYPCKYTDLGDQYQNSVW